MNFKEKIKKLKNYVQNSLVVKHFMNRESYLNVEYFILKNE
jgi:hypothetical protein